MINTKDIRDKIESDFNGRAPDVFKLLGEAITKTDHLKSDRIVRCILFLADRDIDKLIKNIQAATHDPRDVMLWAEYTNLGQLEKLKRIRDFSKTFDTADKNVGE